jgi:hypothetical protein
MVWTGCSTNSKLLQWNMATEYVDMSQIVALRYMSF